MYLCFSITHTQETGRKYINNLSMLGGGITDDFFSKFATFNFSFYFQNYTMKEKWKWKPLSRVRLFATPELSRSEHWSG